MSEQHATGEPGAARASRLTPAEIDRLRARAAREAGPHVDARVLVSPVHNGEWCSEILGRPFPGERYVTWPERYLLHIATAAEPCPPPPPLATAAAARIRAEREAEQQRRADEHARQVAAWERLRDALPVPAEVRHNYTSHRHLGHYSQGGDHVYLPDGLVAGRLKRPAGRVLCWTPSRDRDLREFPEPATDGRVPSCRACLRTAVRLTGVDAGPLLLPR
ncbi:hypothetical protein H114_32604 [Streptomyces gancidicus BKS 13-15]|uniref:Uncharacterized protein n=1 Tax=Streptomyces gancidicus BKS 13-15 TaxID=1284664 RepID=M3DFG8_STREZ|nr:hypothetical protein [Streptomyces gancidicus]EMF20382.1 hypothetical protein H114_32604 [Streptomyces gancidicus BKS 13-15]